MKRNHIIIIVLLVLALIIGGGVFYFFFFTETCTDEECFLNALRTCQRTTYMKSSQGNAWQYTIQPLGFSQGICNVKVKNLAIASELPLARNIEGKSMSCKIPAEFAGTFIQVQSKLEFCSGPLKESLQDLLIDQLYKFIVQHIGEITEEIRGQVQ